MPQAPLSPEGELFWHLWVILSLHAREMALDLGPIRLQDTVQLLALHHMADAASLEAILQIESVMYPVLRKQAEDKQPQPE